MASYNLKVSDLTNLDEGSKSLATSSKNIDTYMQDNLQARKVRRTYFELYYLKCAFEDSKSSWVNEIILRSSNNQIIDKKNSISWLSNINEISGENVYNKKKILIY